MDKNIILLNSARMSMLKPESASSVQIYEIPADTTEPSIEDFVLILIKHLYLHEQIGGKNKIKKPMK